MRRTVLVAWTCASLLAAGATAGHDEGGKRAVVTDERAAPGVIERSLVRLERAMSRLEARLAGCGGGMMDGCTDMMAGGGMTGGGMMGGSRPNERWRSGPAR